MKAHCWAVRLVVFSISMCAANASDPLEQAQNLIKTGDCESAILVLSSSKDPQRPASSATRWRVSQESQELASGDQVFPRDCDESGLSFPSRGRENMDYGLPTCRQ